MLTSLLREPVMLFVAGGGTLVQALLQLLLVFHVPLTSEQQAAITTLTTIIFGLLARQQVTPTVSLPPVIVGAVAEAKATRQAEKSDPSAGTGTGTGRTP